MMPFPTPEKKIEFDSPYPSPNNLNLEIHHIDVGQGDSTLIVVRGGEGILYSVLVDGGETNNAQLIHEYMMKVGIKLLDGMVITHYDADHCRGAIELLSKSKICENVWVFDRGESDDADKDLKIDTALKSEVKVDDREFTDEIEELRFLLMKTSRRRVTAGWTGKKVVGQKLFEFEKPGTLLSMTCISGNGFVLDGKYVRPMHKDRENALSLGFLIQFNEFTYFLGGDSPGTPENDLEGAIGACLTGHLKLTHVCSCKISHHGSHHSTSAEFINLIKPSCAFISCGDHLGHKHPRQKPVTVLQNAPSIQNFFLTRCSFRREHITPHNKLQMGKARVAGSEHTLGTIVLRVDHSMTCYHIFHVGYWDREAGMWRLLRFGCEVGESEELKIRTDEDYALIKMPCGKKTPFSTQIKIMDAIARQRAKFDEKVVCSFVIPWGLRDARRCWLTGDESAEEYVPITFEDQAKVAELDATIKIDIKKDQEKAEADDEDFEFNSEDDDVVEDEGDEGGEDGDEGEEEDEDVYGMDTH